MSASSQSSVDLLLHPVRFRIVQSFLDGRELTVAQVQAEVDGVSPATVYRQIATLAEAEVLEVVRSRQVRGTSERTYRLRFDHAQASPADLRALSTAEHRRVFLTFLAAVMADFERYLGGGDIDLERDGAGYRQAAFWATDDELAQLAAALRSAVEPLLGAAQEPGRRRRTLTTILIPDQSP